MIFSDASLPTTPQSSCANITVVTCKMWSFRICFLNFNHPTMHLVIWRTLLPKKLFPVIICFKKIICLYFEIYNLYHFLPWHPRVCRVSCSNHIFNILYVPLRYQHLIYHMKSILYVISLVPTLFKQLATVIWGTVSLLNSKYPSSHTPSNVRFLSLSRYFFSLG